MNVLDMVNQAHLLDCCNVIVVAMWSYFRDYQILWVLLGNDLNSKSEVALYLKHMLQVTETQQVAKIYQFLGALCSPIRV